MEESWVINITLLTELVISGMTMSEFAANAAA